MQNLAKLLFFWVGRGRGGNRNRGQTKELKYHLRFFQICNRFHFHDAIRFKLKSFFLSIKLRKLNHQLLLKCHLAKFKKTLNFLFKKKGERGGKLLFSHVLVTNTNRPVFFFFFRHENCSRWRFDNYNFNVICKKVASF